MISSFHIIGSRQMGGAERFFKRLVLALKEKQQPVTAIIRHASPLRSALEGKVERLYVPMRNGWDVFSLLTIKKIIRSYRPDIVQTYMGRATRLTRVPGNIKTVHVARLGGYYKIKGYYEHAHAWVGNTKALCDYLINKGIPSHRVYCIGNFVEIPPPISPGDRKKLRESLGLPEDAIMIFSLGRFNSKKAFDTLLHAMALLPSAIHSRPLFLMIAGDGPLAEDLRSLAKKLGIEGRIKWLGWQEKPDPFYDLADIFVCPSRVETLGNVILEAWAHALPVVSTSTPGALELIQNQEDGLLVPIDQPSELADTLIELIKNGPSIWYDIGMKGLDNVKKNHTKEAVVNAYMEMYEQVVTHAG